MTTYESAAKATTGRPSEAATVTSPEKLPDEPASEPARTKTWAHLVRREARVVVAHL